MDVGLKPTRSLGGKRRRLSAASSMSGPADATVMFFLLYACIRMYLKNVKGRLGVCGSPSPK